MICKFIRVLLTLMLSCGILMASDTENGNYAGAVAKTSENASCEFPASAEVAASATYGAASGVSAMEAGMRNARQRRWVLGGNIGFITTDSYTHFNFSPQIGYAVRSNFTVGGGVGYRYFNWKAHKSRDHYLGINLYARVRALKYIALHVQPEIYRRFYVATGSMSSEEIVPSVLAGAGLSIPTGNGSRISAMIYYDLLQDPASPYGNRVFYSMGYSFSF